MITINDLKNDLESKNIRYRASDNGVSIFLKEYSKVIEGGVTIIITDSGEGVFSISLTVAKLLYGVNDAVRDKLNELNKRFRFFSFYHEDGRMVLITTTAMVRENYNCDEIFELMFRGFDIAETAYKELQSAIWS